MLNFSQIYEGWRNKLIPPTRLRELITSTADKRIKICLDCPHHSRFHKTVRLDDHCTDCGCTLSAKTRCLSCGCPLDKWLAVVTDEQEETIKNIIDGKEKRSEA